MIDHWSAGLYLGICVFWFVLIWRAARRATARDRAKMRWGLLVPLVCALVAGTFYGKDVAAQRRCEASAVADLQDAYQGYRLEQVTTSVDRRGRTNGRVPMLHPHVVLRSPSGEQVDKMYECPIGEGILDPQ